jgi:hypothetical protein
MDAFAKAYVARFHEYHLAWSVFFVAHMADLKSHFGDVEDALLLAAFGLGPVAEKLRAYRFSGDPADLTYGSSPIGDGTTNAKRLADITGIPRETVRRKLRRFEKRGWIAQADDASWRIAVDDAGRATVAADLEAANARFLVHLSRLMADFERIRDGQNSEE